jgi:hypothetical protein
MAAPKNCMNCAHRISSFAGHTEGRQRIYVVCSRFGANKKQTVLSAKNRPCWRERGDVP